MKQARTFRSAAPAKGGFDFVRHVFAMRSPLLRAVCAGLAVAGLQAAAGERTPEPLRDPWLPPLLRGQARPIPRTRGEALRLQVESKLKQSFDAADKAHRGSITREEARAANLGYIAEHFDRIDTARAGRVTFEDVKRYLRSRGARTL
jgi:hypothetical protein